MVIHNDYTTNELLANEPCVIDDKCIIYPLTIKEYSKLIKYSIYIQFSRERLKLNKDMNLLSTTILLLIQAMSESGEGDIIKNIDKVVNDFEKLFLLVTKKEVKCVRVGSMFKFQGDGVVIDDSNYEDVRKVIMTMNLIKEPKVFDDPLYEKMYYKSMKANRKEGASLEDVILTVLQDMKYTFEYIYQLNIMQLYGLYSRCVHVKNSDAITIYRTCSDKLPKIDYTDGVIDNLFKERDDSDLFADLDGLVGKLK